MPVAVAPARQACDALAHPAVERNRHGLGIADRSHFQNEFLGRFRPAQASTARLHGQFLQFVEEELLGLADAQVSREDNLDDLRRLARHGQNSQFNVGSIHNLLGFDPLFLFGGKRS